MKKFLFLLIPFSLFAVDGELLRVVDGDTLLLKDTEGFTICQASFLDTPESLKNEKFDKDFSSCKNIEEKDALRAGEISKEYAAKLLKGVKKVEYKVTRILPNQNPVCQISLPKGTNVLINPTFTETMIEQGFGLPFVIYADDEKTKVLLELAQLAKKEKRGLWKTHEEYLKCLIYKRYSLRSLRD